MSQRWLKRVLIPCWVINILASVLMFVIACFVLGRMEKRVYYTGASSATGGMLVAFTVVTVGLVAYEIAQLARERLGATAHLCSSLFKLIVWIIYLLIAMVGASTGTQMSTSVMSLAVTLILIATNLAQLIYGSVVLHRQRTLASGKQSLKSMVGSIERGTIHLSASDSAEHDKTCPPNYSCQENTGSQQVVEIDGVEIAELDPANVPSELPSNERTKIYEKL